MPKLVAWEHSRNLIFCVVVARSYSLFHFSRHYALLVTYWLPTGYHECPFSLIQSGMLCKNLQYICDRICENPALPAFWNTRTSKTCISNAMCYQRETWVVYTGGGTAAITTPQRRYGAEFAEFLIVQYLHSPNTKTVIGDCVECILLACDRCSCCLKYWFPRVSRPTP